MTVLRIMHRMFLLAEPNYLQPLLQLKLIYRTVLKFRSELKQYIYIFFNLFISYNNQKIRLKVVCAQSATQGPSTFAIRGCSHMTSVKNGGGDKQGVFQLSIIVNV